MSNDIQGTVINRLKALGWTFDRIVTTSGTKEYKTAVGLKSAIVRIRLDREFPQHWLSAEYDSEGRNAVASCISVFPTAFDAPAVEARVDQFIADLERAIAGTYAVRLLQTGGAA